MGSPVLIKDRYELKDVLGRGGMGVVYKAFDTLMRREVALKTLRDVASHVFVDLFYRECSVLTAMVHPNIVEIFDMGEFEEDGVSKPYFVMPLLPGCTLWDLIYPAGAPLRPERCADIVSQACRGLHAAHECGLLHRDIKPRNIFVMRDDAVKLIDFGVVRLLGNQTIGAAGTLGTLNYMAPEQISMKPLTARSDIFSLATVCYEALTGVHPFVRANEADTVAAVLEHAPVLASTLNPLVSKPLAQAVAQAMAKDPRNRFESAMVFADALQRGLRNQATTPTLPANPQNRVARAQRSFARGDYEFAQEILEQLEADGADGPEVRQLRLQLDEAVHKRQAELHLAIARRYFAEEEYVLALRRVTEILDSNPSNHAAVSLKREIEHKLSELQLTDALARASGHLDSGAFTEARRLIEDSLQLQPGNAEAQRLLQKTEQRESDWPRERQQQEALFQVAQTAYLEGRFDTALRSLEELAELTRQSKAAGTRGAEYQDFYNRVRDGYEALQATLSDARKLLANGDLDGAHLLSERLHEQCPQDRDVRALSGDIVARRNEREQEYRRGIEQRIANEPDLSAQLHILTQAVRSRPNDEDFHQRRQKLQVRVQQVAEAAERAQAYEASSRYDYAIEEWLCVGDLHPAYPGLHDHLARVKGLWQSARKKAKAELTEAVTDALRQGNQMRAGQFLQAAQAEFQDDAEHQRLKTALQAAADGHKEAISLLSRIEKAENAHRFADIPELCQAVVPLCQNVDPLRIRTFKALTATATRTAPRNWRVAKEILQHAALIGDVPSAAHDAIAREEREEEVGDILSEERGNAADLEPYRDRLAALLAKYPDELRLEDRLRLIDAALADQRQQNEKRACAGELALLYQELGDAKDHRRLWDTQVRAKTLAAPFVGDPEIEPLLNAIREQVALFEEAAEALSRDRIKDCYAICDSVLALRPGHQLFQKVKDQAALRHRELGEEYFARVERWLASESNLYEREHILEKALAEFPFETRYADELTELRRERALAESLAAKAHDLEKRGQMAEALAQWRQLRNIHPWYPDVDRQIAHGDASLDRQQRKVRAQRLLSQGQTHFAEGRLDEGYQTIHEAFELSHDMPGLLRSVAPDLVAGARAVLPASARQADAMAALAQTLDESLRIPKDLRAKISEACKGEELIECLKTIRSCHEAADLRGALAAADEFLARFPGVRQVESLHSKLLMEVEQERRQQVRAQVLDQFHEMESSAVNMSAPELLNLKKTVNELASRHRTDEEITQRASTLDTLFISLAAVRQHIEARAVPQAEEACARALEIFPEHPLFKSALGEVGTQKAAMEANFVTEVRQQVAAENDFFKQAALVQQALVQFPGERNLIEELSAINARQQELNGQIAKIRSLEAKQLFGEAIKEWEALRRAYPWYSAVDAEVERLKNARGKEKQEALNRWSRQVETAIEGGDYETASAMIRQAQQQQPDRALKGLEDKLNEGLKRKKDSDEQLAAGKRLFADGDLVEGGKTLYRAHELQPHDSAKMDSIALLLLSQVRAHINGDLEVCESLLAHLNRIRPNDTLPPDLKEALAEKRTVAEANRADVRRVLEQLARLSSQAENARSQGSLSSVSKKLQDSGLLDSNNVEVRRGANELLRKINLRLSGFKSPVPVKERVREPALGGSRVSMPGIVAAVLLATVIAGIVYFLSRPNETGVPVQVSVTPDHAVVEVDGQACVPPDCRITLKPGAHVVNVQKAGYKPRSLAIAVRPGDDTPLKLNAALEPVVIPVSDISTADVRPRTASQSDTDVSPNMLAKVDIRGARPHTRIRLDGLEMGQASADGAFSLHVSPGPHTLVLSLDGFSARTIKRDFTRGEIVSLVDSAVQLQPRQPFIQR